MARIESKIKINGLLKPNSVIRDPCIETLNRLSNCKIDSRPHVGIFLKNYVYNFMLSEN